MQRILLAQISAGASELTGQSMMRTIIEQLGTSVSPAGVRKALISVPGDILSNPERGSYVIVDPIFASWLKTRAGR